MTFTAINLTSRTGTEIKSDRAALLSGAYTKEIRDLLEQRGALVFRDLHLTDEEQLAFSESIGDIIPRSDGKKGVYKITLDKNENEEAEILLGTFYWHIDGTVLEVPNRASMLSARRLSPTGGQTEIANTYAAYEELPEAEKKTIDRLRIVHSQVAIQRLVYPNATAAQVEYWSSKYGHKTHPLVWTHKSGRKSLLVGYTADRIEGVTPDESRALMDRLMTWATQPQFVYHHEWRVGDLLIWDNTGVMHRVTPYATDSGRMMHRTTLVGEEAIA
ncbi:MAG: TauD/TfdA family dioxygenase [Rhodospirillaceae bacterium]|nr:MAG: TauD/TfdA family dioxygenase [Rhodospirillaceae bacterium]